MMNRQHIITALYADSRQDLVLAEYAEHGRVSDLVTSIELAGEILGALMKEARAVGRPELATIATKHLK